MKKWRTALSMMGIFAAIHALCRASKERQSISSSARWSLASLPPAVDLRTYTGECCPCLPVSAVPSSVKIGVEPMALAGKVRFSPSSGRFAQMEMKVGLLPGSCIHAFIRARPSIVSAVQYYSSSVNHSWFALKRP